MDNDDDDDEDADFDDASQLLSGKLPSDDDDEDGLQGPLPPLPSFLTTPDLDDGSASGSRFDTPATSTATSSTSSSPAKEGTQARLDEQQRQIDQLMQLIQSQTQSQQQPPPPQQPPQGTQRPQSASQAFMGSVPTNQNANTMQYNGDNMMGGGMASTPLKTMLFIDGTWLFYSIHGRPRERCSITDKFGLAWQRRYEFQWSELPRIICEELQKQQQGWTNAQQGRPVEVTRASVFTSVKAGTPPSSQRMQMFQAMKEANYDVFMMETVGQGEKCIDIQLAVEMLHYATVPNAFDVAILLSGDKDFLPAMLRTRQKAKKVGVVSMRAACNTALYETPNANDYDVIWIEDHLDRLVAPKKGINLKDSETEFVSLFTLLKVVSDFIRKSGFRKVSSRDLGYYLKQLRIGKSNMLSQMKLTSLGLAHFLKTSKCFGIEMRRDQTSAAYW